MMNVKDEVSERTRAVINRLTRLGIEPQEATPEEIKSAERYYKLKQEIAKDKRQMAMMTIEYDIDHIDMEEKVAYVNVAIMTRDCGEFLYTECTLPCEFDEVCEDCAELNELCKKCIELRCEQE